jgi:hypothetical protein
MKSFNALFLFIAFLITACDKSGADTAQDQKPLADAFKTGNWMILLMENNVVLEGGDIFVKFNEDRTLVVTKDGASFSGNWAETAAAGSKMLAMNIITTDVLLKKANRTWKVSAVAETFIDLKDEAASNMTAQLMRH